MFIWKYILAEAVELVGGGVSGWALSSFQFVDFSKFFFLKAACVADSFYCNGVYDVNANYIYFKNMPEYNLSYLKMHVMI